MTSEHKPHKRPSEQRLQALRDYYLDNGDDWVDGEGDVADLFAEIDALKREVDAQMQAKLDAQSLLANIVEALGFDRTDFDLNDTWGTVGPRIIQRLTEIVGRAEEADALEDMQPFPVSTVMSWKRRAEEAEARMAAGRILLDPERQDEPDEENVLRAFEALGGRLS